MAVRNTANFHEVGVKYGPKCYNRPKSVDPRFIQPAALPREFKVSRTPH